MKKTGISSWVFLTLILGIAGFAGHGFYAFNRDLQLMEEVSVEDIVWTSSQLEIELARFRHSLAAFQVEDGGVDANEINERFDILWSRIALFQQGNVGERLLAYSGETDIVDSIFAKMKLLDRRVVNLAEGDNVEAAFILEEFSGYPENLRELSRVVTLGEEKRNRSIRKALSDGVIRTMILAGVATGLAVIALIYIYWQAVKAQNMAEVNRKLASLAEKASRAKSQFLTMMSHELRTPMNGVIGLLAVVKQREDVPQQIELISTAEKSAQKMLELLGDVFDYSALQSETISITNKPFEIAELAKAMHEDIPVTVSEVCPKLFIGDFNRLRQAFTHLGQYIVETAGTHGTSIDFDAEFNNMVMRLSFEYSDEGGAWNPDLILGSDDRSGDKFATDALGPTLARGLIDMMDGVVSVDAPNSTKIVVTCTLPLEAFIVDKLRIKIFASSDAISTICRATIKSDNILFLDSDDERQAHMTLIESGDSAETGFLRKAQNDNPSALLVALGRPLHVEAFDFTTEIPLNFKELKDIILRQIA